jgi:imidazolonepropionase-like amidohydrolase
MRMGLAAAVTCGLSFAGICFAQSATAPTMTASAPLSVEPESFAVRNVLLFDGEQVRGRATVFVRAGRIERISAPDADVPRGYRLFDGRGRTLLPGLIDAHVHVSTTSAASALRQELRFGVTTIFDMFTVPDGVEVLRGERSRDAPDEAGLRMAGIGATVPGGHPTELSSPQQLPIPTIDDPAQAQAFVDARISEGSDYIKIVLDDGHSFGTPNIHYRIMSQDLLRALVRAAHRRGKLVVVHIMSEQQAREALDAGADGLAHTPIGRDLSPDFGAFVRRHHAFVITTLSAEHWFCGTSRGERLLADPRLGPYVEAMWRGGLSLPYPHTPPAPCAAADASLSRYLAAGVPILLGTDSPVPGTTYGISMYDELTRSVEDGLAPPLALRAATATPAQVFGLADRGRVEVGRRADLVLVRGNPTQDISDIANIEAVWKRGTLLER